MANYFLLCGMICRKFSLEVHLLERSSCLQETFQLSKRKHFVLYGQQKKKIFVNTNKLIFFMFIRVVIRVHGCDFLVPKMVYNRLHKINTFFNSKILYYYIPEPTYMLPRHPVYVYICINAINCAEMLIQPLKLQHTFISNTELKRDQTEIFRLDKI